MKEKIKRFFIEKKELLIFIGVVVFVFAAVIGIASLALNNTEDPVDETPPTGDTPSQDDSQANTDNEPVDETPVEVVEKFILPLTGDYVIARTYFDDSLSDEELEAAVINNGIEMVTSTGLSYKKNDNSSFEVLAIYDGVIQSIEEDELCGATITIKHANNITSVYSSLKNLNVAVGAVVSQGDVIATASESINDPEAGVHVHLEVMNNGKYLNPMNIFGKEIDEIVETK